MVSLVGSGFQPLDLSNRYFSSSKRACFGEVICSCVCLCVFLPPSQLPSPPFGTGGPWVQCLEEGTHLPSHGLNLDTTDAAHSPVLTLESSVSESCSN